MSKQSKTQIENKLMRKKFFDSLELPTPKDGSVRLYNLYNITNKDMDQAFRKGKFNKKDVRSLWREGMLLHHPDKGGDSDKAAELNGIYNILMEFNEDDYEPINMYFEFRRICNMYKSLDAMKKSDEAKALRAWRAAAAAKAAAEKAGSKRKR